MAKSEQSSLFSFQDGSRHIRSDLEPEEMRELGELERLERSDLHGSAYMLSSFLGEDVSSPLRLSRLSGIGELGGSCEFVAPSLVPKRGEGEWLVGMGR